MYATRQVGGKVVSPGPLSDFERGQFFCNLRESAEKRAGLKKLFEPYPLGENGVVANTEKTLNFCEIIICI